MASADATQETTADETTMASDRPTVVGDRAPYRLSPSSTYRQISLPAAQTAVRAARLSAFVAARARVRTWSTETGTTASPMTDVGQRHASSGKPHLGGTGYDGGPW
jgi:hypothetical protein